MTNLVNSLPLLKDASRAFVWGRWKSFLIRNPEFIDESNAEYERIFGSSGKEADSDANRSNVGAARPLPEEPE